MNTTLQMIVMVVGPEHFSLAPKCLLRPSHRGPPQAEAGNLDMVRLCLRYNVTVDCADEVGETPPSAGLGLAPRVEVLVWCCLCRSRQPLDTHRPPPGPFAAPSDVVTPPAGSYC